MMDGWRRTSVMLGLSAMLGSGSLAACSETEKEEVREDVVEVRDGVREEAKVVAEVTRETMKRGVHRAKQALDEVDVKPVREAWTSTVEVIKPGPTVSESGLHPLAGASEAIRCSAEGARCTVEYEFAARARQHGAALAAQLRMHPVEGEVRGIRLDLVEVGSVADRLGFQAGDVITHINGIQLGPSPDMMTLYVHARTARHYTVRYRRDGAARVLEVDVI